MDSPGIFALLNDDDEDFAIDAAGTQIGPWIEDLEGLRSLSLHARFAYGAGGTTCKVYIQTSLDQGTTAIDIACFAFATASALRVVNLTDVALTTPTAPTDGTLADNTALNGVLGDRYRAKVITVGTYSGSTLLTLRGCAR